MNSYLPFLAVLLASPGPAQGEPDQKPPAPPAPRVQRVQGRVVDDAFRPIAGAGFTAGALGKIRTVDALERPLARTGDDGTFDFEVTVPGGFEEPVGVLVAAPGRAALRWTTYIPAASTARVGAPPAPVKVGDLRLPGGVVLKGRVRSSDGKPIAGAHVRASDLLAVRSMGAPGGGGTSRLLMTAATTDADGSFALPCSVSPAAQVVADADGCYRRTLAPVSEGEPVVLELEPSGYIEGRVLDDAGVPTAATVAVTYEADNSERQAESVGEDGAFRFTVRYPGRYRLSGNRRAARASKESGVLQGPQQGVDLRVGRSQRRSLVVRALAAETGAPIKAFRAGAYWWQVDPSYLESQFDSISVASEDGQVLLPEPGSEGTQAPLVRVAAEGFAPLLIEAVEVKDEGDTPVEAKLRPQSVAQGRVLDDQTGEPVAGCEVQWRSVKTDDPNVRHFTQPVLKPTGKGTRTADDGSFSVGGLGKGTFELRALHANRPPGKPVQVALADDETKAGVELSIPTGATVSGKISGAPGLQGLRVRLERESANRAHYAFQQQAQDEVGGEGVMALLPDGGYRFAGQAPGSYELYLIVPSSARPAASLRVLVEEFRLKGRDLTRDVDVSEDLPGIVRGRVVVEGTPLPGGRWVVTATQVPDPNEQQVFYSTPDALLTGRRALVQPDGGYELELPVGDHVLQVVDLMTGVLMAKDSGRVAVASGKPVGRDLTVKSVEVRLRLHGEGGGSYVASRLRIEGSVEAYKPQGGNTVFFGGVSGGGPFELNEAPAEVSFFVPPGGVKITAFSGAQRLFRNRSHSGPLTIGDVEFEAELGKVAAATLAIDPPPEIEEEPTGDQGKAAAPERAAAPARERK